jgi:hypothetical protein
MGKIVKFIHEGDLETTVFVFFYHEEILTRY